MALLNYKKKEINAKIVYYGPGLSGKTTNIQYIHSKLRPDHRGKLMTLATQTDRTLFFDFLPVELGEIRGLKTRFQIYTVPGQVFYNATRKLVLKNVDGVVFVADSDPAHMADNIESIKNLEQNLTYHGKDIRSIPLVIQYNKRDLPNAVPITEMQAKINVYGAPYTEAAAGANGKGVLETLTLISKMVLAKLRDSQNIIRVDENAPDGLSPDPSLLAPEPAKAAPAKTKSVAFAKPTPPTTPPTAVSAPDEVTELPEPEIEETIDVEIEDSPAAELPKTAPQLSPPTAKIVVPTSTSGVPALTFKKLVKAVQVGDAVELTLAFNAANQETQVVLRLEIKSR